MTGFRSLSAAAWRADRGRVVRALALALAAGIAEGTAICLLLPLLDLVGLGAFEVPGIPRSLPLVLAAFVVLVGTEALLERAHGRAVARLAVGVAFDLRRRLYGALSGASWAWFSRLRSADAAHALTEEAERAGSAVQALLSALAHGILALVYLGLALAVAPGLLGIAAAAGLLGLLAWFRIREARWWGEESSRTGRDLLAVTGDGMQEARTDRAHGRTVEGSVRFGRAAREAARSRLAVFRHLAGSRALLTTGSAAVLAAFVWVAVALLGTAPASLLLSLFLLNRLLHRAVAVVQQVEMAAADLPGFATVHRMTRASLAAAEPRIPPAAPRPLREGIRLEGVSFSFAGPDGPEAVSGATLAIPAGSLAVVAGPSGSGKTTLADLVAGVLVPDRGRLLVDGAPPDGSWAPSVGYVAQDALLLHGTVRSNLLRARPAAAAAEVDAALSLAGAPGADREVGERGQALSGGERRRVALARALLRRPSLLVLDGVADGLEPAEEARLLDALEGLRGRTTILLVSQGGESARRADLLVRMDRGRAEAAVPVEGTLP